MSKPVVTDAEVEAAADTLMELHGLKRGEEWDRWRDNYLRDAFSALEAAAAVRPKPRATGLSQSGNIARGVAAASSSQKGASMTDEEELARLRASHARLLEALLEVANFQYDGGAASRAMRTIAYAAIAAAEGENDG